MDLMGGRAVDIVVVRRGGVKGIELVGDIIEVIKGNEAVPVRAVLRDCGPDIAGPPEALVVVQSTKMHI